LGDLSLIEFLCLMRLATGQNAGTQRVVTALQFSKMIRPALPGFNGPSGTIPPAHNVDFATIPNYKGTSNS
jgi:hypothetical protein